MHEWNGRHFFALRLEHSDQRPRCSEVFDAEKIYLFYVGCVRVTDRRDRTRNRVTKTIWVDRRRISKQYLYRFSRKWNMI